MHALARTYTYTHGCGRTMPHCYGALLNAPRRNAKQPRTDRRPPCRGHRALIPKQTQVAATHSTTAHKLYQLSCVCVCVSAVWNSIWQPEGFLCCVTHALNHELYIPDIAGTLRLGFLFGLLQHLKKKKTSKIQNLEVQMFEGTV